MHDATLIGTVAVGFGVAFVLGLLATRLSLPPLVGYLVAGIVIGPFTPGFVGDTNVAQELAEVGVVLLMFGVGLHFSPRDLFAVKRIAVPGAFAQMAVATLLGGGVAVVLWGWTWGAGLVFGLALSVASTVVLLRALEERNAVQTPDGRVAVGWLIVEDIAMVVALVLIPATADVLGGTGDHVSGWGLVGIVALTLLKVLVFAIAVYWLGGRFVRWLLEKSARAASRELTTLAVLAIALGVAFGASKIFGVSLALGAFVAGIVVAESEEGKQAATNALPLQDAFAVLFFVSVGMLFDPGILRTHLVEVFTVILVVTAGKAMAAVVIARASGRPLSSALFIGASLAQVGEFSFILAGLGLSLGILPAAAVSLVLAAALFSILMNPLLFLLAERLGNLQRLETRDDSPRHGANDSDVKQVDDVLAVSSAAETAPDPAGARPRAARSRVWVHFRSRYPPQSQ